MLKIETGLETRALKVVIYGAEGIGKSTFASQFPNPLFLDTEGGTSSLNVRRVKCGKDWSYLLSCVDEVIKDPSICKTLVIDTADWAESLCTKFVCEKYRKSNIEEFGFGKGYVYKGKSVNTICRMLEEQGIKTPGHKDHWRTTTVSSILKNEKYKGDCEMQKTYVKNFLDHVSVKNNGKLEKIYVEDHHEPIVSKDHWLMVQLEFERRGTLDQGYNSCNEFSCKLICGDCGSYYGAKVLHSNDKYRSVKYRCNRKYNNEHVCQTPFVTEDEVKTKFILAYNEFIGNREQLIEDCKEMIQVLDNTEELEAKLAGLNQKAEDIIILVKNLIDQNSTEVMDQDDFQKKYDSYDLEHKKVINEIEAVGLEIEKKNAQAKYLQAFIDDLNNRPNILEAYDEDIWSYLIDKAIVNRDKSITFQFRNGKEIRIE